MKRNQQYIDGYRAAQKAIITWLHERASEMNDVDAARILNSAAHDLGSLIRDEKRDGHQAD